MSSKIAALAEDPGQARVLFSNCYRDYAQTSAQPPASKRTNGYSGSDASHAVKSARTTARHGRRPKTAGRCPQPVYRCGVVAAPSR